MPQNSWPRVDSESATHEVKCPYVLSKALLGTGSYANVYECKRIETKAHYAAKRFSKKQIYGLESMLQREFNVLKRISRGHPNILSMIDYFETSDYFYLVTNLANGGELYERITTAPKGKLSVDETREILSVLMSALKYLHVNGVVHRDVKAENILFASKSSTSKSLLLADFGHAQILGQGELVYTLDGTLSYLAPEVLSRTGHSFPVDIWAVGVLTYFMLCGYMPFDCDTDQETKELISKADFVFEPGEYWAHIPEQATDFLAKCFTLDTKERLTAETAANHAFLRGEQSIKGGFSHESLAKLHDSMLKIQQSRQKSMTNLMTLQSPNKLTRLQSATNLSHISRTNSSNRLSKHGFFDVSSLLNGEKCISPEAVTTLTTPVMSAVVSRQHSMTSVISASADVIDDNAPEPVADSTRTGKAKFVL